MFYIICMMLYNQKLCEHWRSNNLNQARSSSAFSGELLLVRCSMSDSWKLIGQFVGKLLALKFMHFFLIKNNVLMKCMKINVVMCDRHYLAWFWRFFVDFLGWQTTSCF